MLAWFLTTIWHALFGLILLITLFLGSAIILGKAMAAGAEHDWRQCSCPSCQDRRNRAFKKRKRNDWPYLSNTLQPGKDNNQWCNTFELEVGWRVLSKSGQGYLVKEKHKGTDEFTIVLENLSTRLPSHVMVLYTAANRKYWRVVDKGIIL